MRRVTLRRNLSSLSKTTFRSRAECGRHQRHRVKGLYVERQQNKMFLKKCGQHSIKVVEKLSKNRMQRLPRNCSGCTFGQNVGQRFCGAHMSTEHRTVQIDALKKPIQVNTVSWLGMNFQECSLESDQSYRKTCDQWKRDNG